MRLDVSGLTVARDGEVVLRDVSLGLRPGELALVGGDSGSGKSTFLAALGGLLALDERIAVRGSATFDGEDLLAPRPDVLAARVGQVLQDARDALLALDVAGEVAVKCENLGWPRERGLAAREDALARWDLADFAVRESHALSTGETKRVALAAACVTRPPLVLLDEPTTGLDREALAALARDLARLKDEGAIVIVAEHRVGPLAALADVAWRVADGEIREEPVLFAKPAVARPFCALDTAARVELDAVTLARDGRPVLRDVSIVLSSGFIALVGPNGSGKTTLLRALAGLLGPESGRVNVEGRVAYASARASDLFLAGSVAEELALGGATDPTDLSGRFGLSGLLDRHPLALSGGERQRLALALVAADEEAHVLLLDEPTVGLDGPARTALEGLIEERVACGDLVVAATHDERLLARANARVVLAGGRAALDRAPEVVA